MDDQTREQTPKPESHGEAYTSPQVTDYGSLQQLTAGSGSKGMRDVHGSGHAGVMS